MKCADISPHLGAWMDQALDSELAETVETHLAGCSSCQLELERLRALMVVLHASATPAPRAALDERVMNAFHERHRVPSRPTTAARGWRRLILGSVRLPNPALAGAVVVIVAALGLAFSLGRMTASRIVLTSPLTPSEQASNHVVELPVGPGRPRAENSPRRRKPLSPRGTDRIVRGGGETAPTLASWEQFEPINGATARVIKGGDQR